MSRQPPTSQPPPVQRLRLRYAKRGRARFASQRDFARAFERALRRVDVPMAYSSGFSPHPRISYANACPTGCASEAEYLEIGLARQVDAGWLADALDAALPQGLAIVAVAESDRRPLASELEASWWSLEFPGVSSEALADAVDAFEACASATAQRQTKNGLRTVDVKPAVVSLEAGGPGVLRVVSLAGTPLVRPDDVASALESVWPALCPTAPEIFTRLAQGRLVDGVVVDPFGPSAG